jgi:hypothetical protein
MHLMLVARQLALLFYFCFPMNSSPSYYVSTHFIYKIFDYMVKGTKWVVKLVFSKNLYSIMAVVISISVSIEV